jgi:4-hydroxy-2-oxoheptanedioate aldolase
MQRNIRAALKQGQVVLGSFFRLPSPDLAEVFGEAGFDFVIIDQEHGAVSVEATANLVRACDLVGMAAIVRIPDSLPWLIQHALDVGALGVQAPQVGTVSDAQRVVRASKFAPVGSRGVCRNVRAARYSARDRFAYMEESNRDTLVVVQIESKEGIGNLAGILSVPGIDVVFLGPYDLSQSLGLPGQVDHPKVRSTMQQAVAACRLAGVAAGVYADSAEAVRHWVGAGVQYVAVGVDTALIYTLTRKFVSELRSGVPSHLGGASVA